jgi:heat shock protein HslJ
MAMGAWSCRASAEKMRYFILICAFVAMLHGDAFSSATGPEDVEWQLVEVAGTPVPPLVYKKQPSLRLDAALKKATGFSGCNNFFSGYEINGSSLKFGLIGATRMACPEQETRVETEFFKALERTRRWKIHDGMLLLTDDGDIFARFGMKRVASDADLESMTFLSTWFPTGKVTLSNGEYRGPAAPGSASEVAVKLAGKSVFGFIDGRETGAVVLVTEPGGSGTFYDLALLVNKAGKWTNTDIFLLGDRVKVHSVKITHNQIVVEMRAHAPRDPMCCPTREMKKRFAVHENRLVPVTGGEKDKGERDPDGSPATGEKHCEGERFE